MKYLRVTATNGVVVPVRGEQLEKEPYEVAVCSPVTAEQMATMSDQQITDVMVACSEIASILESKGFKVKL